MSLMQAGKYNDFTPKFRTELEQRVRDFGKSVRYKFDVGRKNPDPTNHDGDTVYPNMYTLDPVTFYITDANETREGKSKSKEVMLVSGTNEKGVPDRFKKAKVAGRSKSILYLDLTVEDDFQMAMYLELHPKNGSGMFPNKDLQRIVSRVDDMKEAKAATESRQEKRNALNTVADMDYEALIKFADAMQWDSTEDETILRDKAEQLAETTPKFFNDLVASKLYEYKILVKQAKDRVLISYDPADGKWVYAGTKQPLAVVSTTADKNEIETLAEWLLAGGKSAEAAHDKLKSLLKGEELPA